MKWDLSPGSTSFSNTVKLDFESVPSELEIKQQIRTEYAAHVEEKYWLNRDTVLFIYVYTVCSPGGEVLVEGTEQSIPVFSGMKLGNYANEKQITQLQESHSGHHGCESHVGGRICIRGTTAHRV